jgi:hypothetical protein
VTVQKQALFARHLIAFNSCIGVLGPATFLGMKVKSLLSNESVFVALVLCLVGVLLILFGLSLPVLDDLCGPTDSQELQNTTPVSFWTCVTIPVLLGAFLLKCGVCKARSKGQNL